MIVPALHRLVPGAGLLWLAFLISCSAQNPVAPAPKIRLDDSHLHSFDGDRFPFSKWLPSKKPEIVVIGVHGISGAALDFNPLASHLLKANPSIAVYAAETRGQGNDPVVERRGHIRDSSSWFKDLTSFTTLIRRRYPEAKIIWCGESMGSLIVLHCYAAATDRANLCDAMVLSSPITAIRGDFPQWKITLANIASSLFPRAMVSLETLSGQSEVRVTKDTVHQEQATTNPYHLEKHSLHLLTTLGKMMETAPEAGKALDLPVLVLHGGKDIFSVPEDVRFFVDSLPETAKATRRFYPDSFHLLFYDHESEKVIKDIADWIEKLPFDPGKDK